MEDAGDVEDDEPAEEEDEEAVGGVLVFDGGGEGEAGGDEGEAGSDDPEVMAGEVVRDQRGEEAYVEKVLDAEDDHGDGKEEAAGHERVPASGGEAVEDERGAGQAEALEEEGSTVAVVENVVEVHEVEGGGAEEEEAEDEADGEGSPGGEKGEAGGDADGGERVGKDVVVGQPDGAEGKAAAEMSVEGVLDAEAQDGQGVEDSAQGGECGGGGLGHWVDFTLGVEWRGSGLEGAGWGG